MIIYGCAVTDGDVFARCAEAGVRRLADAGGELLAQPSVGSLPRNYNLLRERAAERSDLEALVLLHQDVEIVDPRFAQTVRDTLADPDVAVAGCAGAIGVRGLAWWEGSITWASVTQRYEEFGGAGEVPGVSWRADDGHRGYVGTGEVDAIDGCLIVLSPMGGAQPELRRAARPPSWIRRRHLPAGARRGPQGGDRGPARGPPPLARPPARCRGVDPGAHRAGREVGGSARDAARTAGDWRRRALRAEAEASAYRLRMGAAELQRNDARGKLLETWRSPSWTWTEPVRRLGARIRRSR